MSTWYDLGYFSDDLELAYGENSMFLPLKSYKEISMSKISSGGGSISGNQTPKQYSVSSLPLSSNSLISQQQ
jgi:hypothetical protein